MLLASSTAEVCASQQPVDHPSLLAGPDVVGLIYSCSLCFTTARRSSITTGRPGCCWPHLQMQSSRMLLASSTDAVCESQQPVHHPSLLTIIHHYRQARMLLASSTDAVCESQQPVDHPSLLAGPDVVGLIYSCSLCFTTARRSSITTGRPGCCWPHLQLPSVLQNSPYIHHYWQARMLLASSTAAVCASQQPVDHPSLLAGPDVVGLIYSCSLCFTTARRPSITIGRPGCCWPHLQLQSVIHNSP
ncbi:hypothetical protein J6590_006626 [Homalodisca vitripennis]|nr:hypothetical protein J6590_006626 [Homalodisca vitripennis]